MHRLLPLLFVAVVVAVAADPPKEKGTKYAFLVGCAGYEDLTPIKGEETIHDVIEFKKALLATGFQDEHVVLLHDKQAEKGGAGRRYLPERAKIGKELDLLLDGLTNDDTVVLALSGHGLHFKGDKFGYFCPVDAKVGDRTTLLPMDGEGGVYAKLAACKAGRKLLIANACRDDGIVRKGDLAGAKVELTDEYPEAVPEGIATIYSCDVGQRSYYDAERKRSLFFLHLTDAWRGGANLEDVFAAARTRTKTDANRTFGEKQTPVVKRGYAGEWVLAGPSRKPGDEVRFEIADGVRMTFCWIPPGKETLGSPDAEAERQPDEKERGYATTGFWLGKYEVTQQEWTAVMKTTPFSFHPLGVNKDVVKDLVTSRFPAERVSWDDAQEFLTAVNKRGGTDAAFGGAGRFTLPHEDEWEYACRGGKGNRQPFYWGSTLDGTEANCDGKFPYGTTTKGEYKGRPKIVGSFTSEAPHPWGLCDMAGNVSEWCEEEYTGEHKRVLRGGSWISGGEFCRSARRVGYGQGERLSFYGFRVVFRLN